MRRVSILAAVVLVAGAGPAQASGIVPLSAATSTLVLAVLAGVGMLAAGVVMLRMRRMCVFEDDFHASPHPRQIVDRKGRVVHANEAGEAYFGDTATAMPDLLASRVEGHAARERLAGLAHQAGQGDGGDVEVSMQDARGGRIWLVVHAQPIKGANGKVSWVAEDVTTRRQMEEKVQAEQARFVDLLEHAPVGFYSVNSDGAFRFANATLASWLGTTPEQLIASTEHLHDLVPAAATAGQPAYSPFPDGGVGDGRIAHGEVTFVAPALGQEIQAYVTQEVVPGEDGSGPTTRSVVRNLSRERAFAEALERSERRFRRFFEQSPVGIGLLDSQGRVTECNAAFVRLLSRSMTEVVGQPLLDLVRQEDRDDVRGALRAADGQMESPAEVHGLDGQTVCTLFVNRLEHWCGDENHVVRLIDTTEHKNLEVQFAHSQKMQAVGQLAGGIAHDFNNLLTAMIGFCDLLLLRHRPGDQSFADLMQIKQNANRAANLVRQLLAFSRQQTLRPTVLSITDVLAELMHLLRRLIGENIELDVSHGRDLYPVKVDQGQLEQVIINLAVNARDAMGEEGGQLSIRTRNVSLNQEVKHERETVPPGDYVLISFKDTGCGIARENLDRVFEPFFSTKEFGAGTGLGLSTVYGIVKQTGGFILVDSEPGRGTTFRIYLPRYEEAAREAPQPERERPQMRDLTGIGTLLLVEDEDAVRSFSARALRKKGYNVLEADSGEQALELLESDDTPVDLLITDVVMPQVDGPTLVKRVRTHRPQLKVIFISGYTEDSFRQHLDGEGGIHFLPKPFSLKQLAGTVKEVLREGTA